MWLGVGLAVALLLGAEPTRAECPRPTTTRLIPLPVWATAPNEGSTWGFMPVFLRVCPDDQRTEAILAPSLTWNSTIRYTASFRLFQYPDAESSFTLIASASTRINFNGLALWERSPAAPGTWTTEASLRLQRNVFRRFFGLGPMTPEAAESSYTGVRAYAIGRRGLNLTHHLNVGILGGIERDEVQAIGVTGLPLSKVVFPDVPGMNGATIAWVGASLRFDDRAGGDYAERGLRAELSGAGVVGLDGSPSFLRGGLQISGVVRELPWLSGAARLAWSGVTSREAPFYQQSRLGGSFLLRGFTEDRFIDRQFWTLDVEQRLRVLRTRILGVVTDWRVDPFVSTGQVYDRFDQAFSRPRVAVGLGLRIFVHPNVVGRIDLAHGGEGLKVYVEIGYPY